MSGAAAGTRAPNHGTQSHRLDRGHAPVIVVSAAVVGVGASLGFIPGFLATALSDDLGVSRGQVGLIVGVYFGCTGLGSVLGGRLTDRLGARVAIVLDMVVVAAAACFVSLVGRYWAWLLAAIFAGAGYALANAGTNVALARSTPAQSRTLAMSIKTAGVPTMATLTAAVGPLAAERWSWQLVIGVAMGVALAVAIAAAVVIEPHRSTVIVRAESGHLPRGFVWFAIAAFLVIAGSQPLYSWTVAYLEQALDTSAGVAGGVTAIASAVGVCFMVLNGARADRVGPARRIHRIMILVTINAAATTLVLAGLAAGVTVVFVGAVLGISTQLASIGTMHAAVVDRAPDAVARATGVTMTGYYLGALAAPSAFGALTDATGTFAWSWLMTIALLLLALPAWVMAGRVTMATAVSNVPTVRSPDHRGKGEP
jgi:MFS family permease